MKSARIINDVAVDVVVGDPAEFFHPAIATQFEPVIDLVEPGWCRTPQGDWVPPESIPAAGAPQSYPIVGPTAFKMLFTSPERIKAKQLRAAGDAVLDDFWGLLDDPRTQEVDLGLASVQAAIEYTLTVVAAADVAIDVPARKAAILTGIVQ